MSALTIADLQWVTANEAETMNSLVGTTRGSQHPDLYLAATILQAETGRDPKDSDG